MANGEIKQITLPLTSGGGTYNIVDQGARDLIANLPSPMLFKGTLGTNGTITSLPTASASNEGFTYKVITAGTYAGQSAKVGDVFISNGIEWTLVPSGDEPSGTVTNIATGAGLTGGPITSSGTISHATSGVTAGTAQGITVNQYGHVTAIQDMGYISSVSPELTGNVNMKGADKVEAPTINYDTYDETTQASCVATMGAMLQTIKKMTESIIEGSQLVLSGFDTISGTTLVLN